MIPDSVNIQKARPDQVKAVDELYELYAGRSMDPRQLSDDAIINLPSVVVMDGSDIIGFATSLKFAPDIVELANMFVHPDYRNKGLGGKILPVYESQARDMGFASIIAINSDLYEGKQDRTSAEPFYTRNDYKIAIRTPGSRVFYKNV